MKCRCYFTCRNENKKTRQSAFLAAIFSMNVSILVVLIYSWRIGVNYRKHLILQDVYYGVQVAYLTIIGTHLFSIILSVILLFGIIKENVSFVTPWIVGLIAFIALEVIAIVYSNVLRDHVNKEFDSFCKAEVIFFISRTICNVCALSAVMRMCNLLKVGVTWKGPETMKL